MFSLKQFLVTFYDFPKKEGEEKKRGWKKNDQESGIVMVGAKDGRKRGRGRENKGRKRVNRGEIDGIEEERERERREQVQ